MTANGHDLSVTLAIEPYDRHAPLFAGAVQAAGLDLTVLEVGQTTPLRHGHRRHERMFEGEFDVAELSLCSYLIARDLGQPLVAIPVFPRRLFSPSLWYKHRSAGIEQPRDLEGKRVGITSYQVTLAVLAKGDLAHEYGVDWKSITWVQAREDAVPVPLPPDVKVERGPGVEGLGEMLARGEIQALAMPHPPQLVLNGDPRVERLFPNPQAEDSRYFQRNGFYPIMHVIAIKEGLYQENPWIARSLEQAFAASFAICRHHYDDPNWSRLAWGRKYLEDELRIFGTDPWTQGLEPNRANLERFIGYARDQGLLSRALPVDELFV